MEGSLRGKISGCLITVIHLFLHPTPVRFMPYVGSLIFMIAASITRHGTPSGHT